MSAGMIEFIKLAKNPRVGPANAIKIQRDLWKARRVVELGPTAYFDCLKMRPNGADWIAFEQVFRYLCYGELEKMGPIRTVIDAGANIGLASVFFSKRLGNPRIVALEPEAANYRLAVENTSGLESVKVLEAALWHDSGAVHISNPETVDSLGFQVESVGNGASIQALTIPEILASEGWRTVDLVKIDIEGAEKLLFEHSSHQEWLNKVRILVVELHDWLRPGCSMAFFRAIASLEEIEMSLSGENLVIVNKCVSPTTAK